MKYDPKTRQYQEQSYLLRIYFENYPTRNIYSFNTPTNRIQLVCGCQGFFELQDRQSAKGAPKGSKP
jgi:hypothetical protein